MSSDGTGRIINSLNHGLGPPPGARLTALALACTVSVLASAPAAAVGLGPVIEQSALGQPLRVVVPVIAGAGDDLAGECFKLAATEADADGVPRVVFGRVSVEHAPSGTRLVVSHPRPVNDPVLRLTLQAGCDTAVRREYTLLMDLPPIDVPLVAAETAAPGEVAAPPPPPARPARSAGDAARGTARAGAAATGDALPAPRKAAPTKARGAPKGAARRTPPAASAQPRLRLSNAPPAAPDAALRSGTAAQQAQTEQEIANAIEAETVVVQARLAELTAMVEKLQQELRESESADRAAEQAAKAPPPPPPAPPVPWWEANWPILAAIVGMAILVAGALLWKRRRDASTRGADWQATTAVGPSGADTISRLRREQVLRSAPAGLVEAGAERGPATRTKAPPAPVSRPAAPPVTRTPTPPITRTAGPPVTRDTAGALAVSELSQVTEEARVYVALGHPDRAIDVLNEHIKRLPRSMPAAWLMLLGLYHANGRRQEFRRVAEEFHVHFNVQTPLWDGFAVSESGDGGLESFPQIVKQVVGLWGQPACRAYLERLLYDNREGRRMGFPLAAYSDILLLLQISDVPPEIDIDRDLAKAGKLGPGRAPAATMPQAPKPASRPAVRLPPVLRSPPAADPARPRKPMPPDPAAQARAPQSPISFELDLDRDAGKPGKKTS